MSSKYFHVILTGTWYPNVKQKNDLKFLFSESGCLLQNNPKLNLTVQNRRVGTQVVLNECGLCTKA